MQNIKIITFGCRLNTLESEVIRNNAIKAGLRDCLIFNTCAVTNEAERQVRQAVRKYRKEYPDSIFIITGCSAQASFDTYSKMNEVDFILGNKEKLTVDKFQDVLETIKGNSSNHVFVSDVFNEDEVKFNDDFSVDNFEDRTRGFVQIQRGCRNRCSFCIISLLRGNSKSFPLKSILNQCQSLVDNGYKEIVLTGVDIASYGADIDLNEEYGVSKKISPMDTKPLAMLIEKILKDYPQIKRIRLSSLDPALKYDDLFNLMAKEPHIMPHIHLSLQNGDNEVLKGMRRRHKREDVLNICKLAKEIVGEHIAIGADIITGFPNETDDNFENTLELVKEANITHLHTFPYSERKGTYAADNLKDNVRKDIAKRRAKVLREEGEKNMQNFLSSQIGSIKEVLIESSGLQGYCENYILCKIDTLKQIDENTIAKVKVKSIEDNKFICDLI